MAVVLIFGSKGQLGHELLRARFPAGVSPLEYGEGELDITDRASVDHAITETRPLLVINAAAYTAVDKAENESERAYSVNCDGAGFIAQACARTHTPLFHVSTDYVFDGEKGGAYLETDPVHPLGVYGLSKAAGEQAVRSSLEPHIILRTSWVFGFHGHNFVKTMLRLSRQLPELKVVNDQRGRPTPARDLAAALVHLTHLYAQDKSLHWGTYHFAGHGTVTWYDFACVIVELQARWTGFRPRVAPIATADYPTPARRPRNSELSSALFEKSFALVPRPWRLGLEEVLEELFKA